MTMREKIARAAEIEFMRQYNASSWETAKDAAEDFDQHAMCKAVLDAMREPTESMVKCFVAPTAPDDKFGSHMLARRADIWRAMIDAAKEQR
jgi:hydrogenase maturation factor